MATQRWPRIISFRAGTYRIAGHAAALLVGACAAAVLVVTTHGVSAQDTPPEILAVQLREQGYRCDGPVAVQREAQSSRPDQAVWIVRCVNAAYRMRLNPDMAARVEPFQ
jgi:hypothetical protein